MTASLPLSLSLTSTLLRATRALVALGAARLLAATSRSGRLVAAAGLAALLAAEASAEDQVSQRL
ncbi:MAG: hypothetical protein IT370_28815 [Deltaproteobacteria bacterium]|nr:hypothetical protein [Deltaproteobacteria bacterium]